MDVNEAFELERASAAARLASADEADEDGPPGTQRVREAGEAGREHCCADGAGLQLAPPQHDGVRHRGETTATTAGSWCAGPEGWEAG